MNDCELTKSESEVINSSVVHKEFKIIDIFDVRNSHNILKSDVLLGTGKHPYVTASRENNGVMGYIDYNNSMLEFGNCIFIGGKSMTINYQEHDFFSNDSHNLILSLKD